MAVLNKSPKVSKRLSWLAPISAILMYLQRRRRVVASILWASREWPYLSPPSACRLLQGHHHLLIVHEVVEGELPAPPVLEPLLTDPVAANVKLPNLLWNALEVLAPVDVDVARRSFFVGYELGKALPHDVVPGHGIAGYELAELGALQQMQGHQLLSQDAEFSE